MPKNTQLVYSLLGESEYFHNLIQVMLTTKFQQLYSISVQVNQDPMLINLSTNPVVVLINNLDDLGRFRDVLDNIDIHRIILVGLMSEKESLISAKFDYVELCIEELERRELFVNLLLHVVVAKYYAINENGFELFGQVYSKTDSFLKEYTKSAPKSARIHYIIPKEKQMKSAPNNFQVSNRITKSESRKTFFQNFKITSGNKNNEIELSPQPIPKNTTTDKLTQLLNQFNELLCEYSNEYCEEQTFHECLKSNTKPNKKKGFKRNYPTDFVNQLIVLQVIQNLHSKLFDSTIDSCKENQLNFYVLCIQLQKFLNLCNIENPIKYSKLKRTVTELAKKFTLGFTEEEYKSMYNFILKELVVDIHSYKYVLDEYKSAKGESQRILKILEIFNAYKSFDKYEIISVLGHGGEGVVFKAFDLSIDELVAIKINFEQEYDLERAYSKIEFLKRPIEGKIGCLDCGLVEFGGNRSKYLYSVMELGEKTLREIISSFYQKTQTSTTINRKHQLIEKIEIFSKILTSIQSVHNQNIVHRDLDPKNIVKFKSRFKIIDFDQSRIAEIGRSITINIGKYCYMAPEISENSYEYNDSLINESKLKQNNNVISTSCDIFSLGCILFELLTNCPLRLNRNLMNNTFNNKNDSYFDLNGFYFHACVLTNEGEKKLHFGIQKELETQLDCDEQAKKLLSESIITMIQRDSDKRLNAFTYKLIMDNLIKYLHGEIADCSQDIEATLIPLDNIPNFNEIFSENDYSVIEILNINQKLEEEHQLLLKEKNLLQKGYKLEYSEKNRKETISFLSELENLTRELENSLGDMKRKKELLIEENKEKQAHQLQLKADNTSQQVELDKLRKWKRSILNEKPLPPGWNQVLDKQSNEFYYYNQSLNINQWERPFDK